MKTIWKFPLSSMDVNYIKMPEGAKILTVQTQMETPCIWALVNPTAQMTQRVFRTVGTGHDLPEQNPHNYIGTFQLMAGQLVFHLFEINL